MEVYNHLLRFAVKPDALVAKLDLVSQEWENANEARDGSQGVERRGRLSLRNVTRINARQETLTKTEKKIE